MAVSFLGGGKRSIRRKPQTWHKSIANFITKCCIEYTSPLAGFEPTTLVVIGTAYIGSYKSNYHVRSRRRQLLPFMDISGLLLIFWWTLFISNNSSVWLDPTCFNVALVGKQLLTLMLEKSSSCLNHTKYQYLFRNQASVLYTCFYLFEQLATNCIRPTPAVYV